MLGVTQPQLGEEPLQRIEHRLPVHPGGLHRHRGHLAVRQPPRQGTHPAKSCLEPGLFDPNLAVLEQLDASHHAVAVHIQTRYTIPDPSHHNTPKAAESCRSERDEAITESGVRARSDKPQPLRSPHQTLIELTGITESTATTSEHPPAFHRATADRRSIPTLNLFGCLPTEKVQSRYGPAGRGGAMKSPEISRGSPLEGSFHPRANGRGLRRSGHPSPRGSPRPGDGPSRHGWRTHWG